MGTLIILTTTLIVLFIVNPYLCEAKIHHSEHKHEHHVHHDHPDHHSHPIHHDHHSHHEHHHHEHHEHGYHDHEHHEFEHQNHEHSEHGLHDHEHHEHEHSEHGHHEHEHHDKEHEDREHVEIEHEDQEHDEHDYEGHPKTHFLKKAGKALFHGVKNTLSDVVDGLAQNDQYSDNNQDDADGDDDAEYTDNEHDDVDGQEDDYDNNESNNSDEQQNTDYTDNGQDNSGEEDTTDTQDEDDSVDESAQDTSIFSNINAQDVQNIGDKLKEIGEFFSSKEVKGVLKAAGKIFNLIGGAADFLAFGLALIPQDNAVLQRLEQLSTQIDEGFELMGSQIEHSELDNEALQRKIQFENLVDTQLQPLVNDFKTYLSDPKNQRNMFKPTCKKYDPTDIIDNMETILKSNGLKEQLKKDGCNYDKFMKFRNIFEQDIKIASTIIPFCYHFIDKNTKAINGTINQTLNTIKNIDNLLDGNFDWCKNYFLNGLDGIDVIKNNAETLLRGSGNSEYIAKNMQKWLTDNYKGYKDINIGGSFNCNHCVYAVMVSEDKLSTVYKCKAEESHRQIQLNGKVMHIFAQSSDHSFTESNSALGQALTLGLFDQDIIDNYVKGHNVNCVLMKSHFENDGLDFSFILNDESRNAIGNHGIFELGEATSTEEYRVGANGVLQDIFTVASLGFSDVHKAAKHFYLVTAGNGQQIANEHYIPPTAPPKQHKVEININNVAEPVAHEAQKFVSTLGHFFGKK